jgi:hypothetical protein
MSDTNQQTFLSVSVPITWVEWKLPTPRHRKLQLMQAEGHAVAAIRTVAVDDTVLAFSYTNESSGTAVEYRAVGDELFFLPRDGERDIARVDEAWLLRRANAVAADFSHYEQHDVREKIANLYSDAISIDGVMWAKSLEPQYRVMTFGMGGNYGSTALTIERSPVYRENDETLFLADEYDAAVSRALEVATTRDDTDSLDRIRNAPKITIHAGQYVGTTMPRVHRMELPSFYDVSLAEYVQIRAGYIAELRAAGAIVQRDGADVVDFDKLTDGQAYSVRSMLEYSAKVGLLS